MENDKDQPASPTSGADNIEEIPEGAAKAIAGIIRNARTCEFRAKREEADYVLIPEAIEAAAAKAEKYELLVWYARKPRREDPGDYWEGTPDDVRERVERAQAEVQDDFPRECAELGSPTGGDFAHGFNSGCLAAFRWILTAADPELALYLNECAAEDGLPAEDPETFDPFTVALENAEEAFPQLDT